MAIVLFVTTRHKWWPYMLLSCLCTAIEKKIYLCSVANSGKAAAVPTATQQAETRVCHPFFCQVKAKKKMIKRRLPAKWTTDRSWRKCSSPHV
jgi:hypothetical protein